MVIALKDIPLSALLVVSGIDETLPVFIINGQEISAVVIPRITCFLSEVDMSRMGFPSQEPVEVFPGP